MKNIVKKSLLIVMVLALILSLCCCGGNNGGEASKPDNTNTNNSQTTSDDTDNNSSVEGTISGENGDTTISSTPGKPTVSESTNKDPAGNTLKAVYDWHPGLVDKDVAYTLNVSLNGSAVNAGDLTITSATTGVKISGTTITLPYSVRSAGKNVVVTIKHKKGTKCDVSIPCYSYKQTFNDDFDGNELNRTKWRDHGPGSSVAPSDVDTYEVIDRAKAAKNSYEVKDGKLYMLIKKEPVYDTANKIKYLYSECCLDTQGNFMQKYGLFEARIACAKFGGINTAFWLLPNGSYSTQYTNFKAESPEWGLAEIDILEASVAFGKKDRKTFCITEHYYNYKKNLQHVQESKYYKVSDTITNFHTYSCVWTKDALYYYLDGELIRTADGLSDKGTGDKSVQRAYIIIDNALYLDNAWVGKRDFTEADLPISSVVDWVRAYKF